MKLFVYQLHAKEQKCNFVHEEQRADPQDEGGQKKVGAELSCSVQADQPAVLSSMAFLLLLGYSAQVFRVASPVKLHSMLTPPPNRGGAAEIKARSFSRRQRMSLDR